MHLKKPKALHFDEHRTHEGRARHKFNVYIFNRCNYKAKTSFKKNLSNF